MINWQRLGQNMSFTEMGKLVTVALMPFNFTKLKKDGKFWQLHIPEGNANDI